MTMNKKGLFFWIELILLVIVLTLVILGFPRSEDNFLASKDSLDLEKLGFTTLQSLDNAGILENYINITSFQQSNFTVLSFYIKAPLRDIISPNIEYFNGTRCFSESGTLLGNCGNVTRTKDTATAEYTYAKIANPITIRLYLRRILG